MKALLLLCALAGANALSIQDLLPSEPITPKYIGEQMLEYYQARDPRGIPILRIPDPLVVEKEFSYGGLGFSKFIITGHHSFKLKHINVNVSDFSFTVRVRLPGVWVSGPYTEASYFSGVTVGEMAVNVTMLDVTVRADVRPEPNTGILHVNDIKVTVEKEALLLEFDPGSITTSIIGGAADTAMSLLTDTIVNSRLGPAKDKLNARLKPKIEKLDIFPPGIPPLDMLLVKVLALRLPNPLPLPDKLYDLAGGMMRVNVSGMQVSGLRSLHRAGDVSIQLIDDRLHVSVQVGVGEVGAVAVVEARSLGGLLGVDSRVELRVEGFAVWVELQQSLDVRRPGLLRRLNIHLGEVSLVSSGDSSVSYALEAAGSGLLNLLRHHLTHLLEKRLTPMIQKRIESHNIDSLVRAKLDTLPDRVLLQ